MSCSSLYRRHNNIFFGLLWLAILVTGCGDGNDRPVLKGTVVYNGSKVNNKTLFFKFEAETQEGSFTQMISLPEDGVFQGELPKPGNYKVFIAESLAVMERRVDADKVDGTQLKIPPKYKEATTSDVSVTIKSGLNNLAIELKD